MGIKNETDRKRYLIKTLSMTAVVTLLVGLKLVLSYFVPGLRTPGELIWSGALLLFTTIHLMKVRSEAR